MGTGEMLFWVEIYPFVQRLNMFLVPGGNSDPWRRHFKGQNSAVEKNIVSRMLLKLRSGKPSTCLDFQEDSTQKLCTCLIFLKLIRFFCVTKHSSEAVRYNGCLYLCTAIILPKLGDAGNHALLSWTNSILTAPEMCKEGDIENRKLERAAGFNFFFFLAHVWRLEIDNAWFLQAFFNFSS